MFIQNGATVNSRGQPVMFSIRDGEYRITAGRQTLVFKEGANGNPNEKEKQVVGAIKRLEDALNQVL